MGNALPCCYLVQTVWSFHIQPQNVKNKIHNTLILAVVLLECRTSSPSVMKEHWLKVLKTRVLMGVFLPSREEVTERLRYLHSQLQ